MVWSVRDLRLMVLGDLSKKTFIDRPMRVMTSVRCINGCMVGGEMMAGVRVKEIVANKT